MVSYDAFRVVQQNLLLAFRLSYCRTDKIRQAKNKKG